jgi:hypothetical protein
MTFLTAAHALPRGALIHRRASYGVTFLRGALWLGVGLLILPAVAGADPTGEELQTDAVRHSGWGDHVGAIDRLERACAIIPSSDCMLLLAREHEALARKERDVKELDRAITACRDAALLETNATQRRALDERIEALDRERRSFEATPSVPDGAVRIGFLSEKGGVYLVNVGAKTCVTPCSLELTPGRYLLTTGAGTLTQDLLVRASTPGLVHLRPNAERLLLPGIVLTILGGVVSSTAWLFAVVPSCSENGGCGAANVILWPTLGGAMFFTGVGMLGYWSGHHSSEAIVESPTNSSAHAANETPGFRLVSLGFQPTPGGAAGGAGFAF